MGQITNLDDRYDMKCITLNACKSTRGAEGLRSGRVAQEESF